MGRTEKEKIIYIPDKCNDCQFNYPGNPFHDFCFLFKGYSEEKIQECNEILKNGRIIIAKKHGNNNQI
jgi:hypothetical protein